MDTPASKPAKRSLFSMFAWWKVDQAELARQSREYGTLKITQSARGQALLASLVSVAITLLFGRSIEVSWGAIAFEAVLWSFLGFMMYRGHRWAFVTAMLFWTLEKGMMIVATTAIGRVPFTQVIWWALYMSIFYLGLRVESRRVNLSVASAVSS